MSRKLELFPVVSAAARLMSEANDGKLRIYVDEENSSPSPTQNRTYVARASGVTRTGTTVFPHPSSPNHMLCTHNNYAVTVLLRSLGTGRGEEQGVLFSSCVVFVLSVLERKATMILELLP